MTEDDATFAVEDDSEDATGVLRAIAKAEDAFSSWHELAKAIDDIYSLGDASDINPLLTEHGWRDSKLDLFWSSFEVMKVAVYARPPQPVVAPLFKDNKRLENTTAELLERCAVSVFKRTDIDAAMVALRDDVLFAGRGALWLRYENEDGEQRVCVEHKDRLDFLHEPARYWSEVGWVAGASWMTRAEMRDRFDLDGNTLDRCRFTVERERGQERHPKAVQRKCKVWEVWHRADDRVYWVTDGVDTFLDKDEPHLDLSGFFPCPRPAYGTLRRRSLIPVPDWERYSIHFRKISDLTSRIYLLLEDVRMKGLVPAGGDIGDAIEQLLRSDDDRLIVPVPGAAMLDGGAQAMVVWMPLKELAEAIQGLIQARAQLMDDFYQLSGISDIMRGATEADETLGAQQLKSQYGSVRVREKSAELQRCAADAVKIAAEIIADKFTKSSLLDLSRMDLPTRRDIKDRIKEVEDAAHKEIAALGVKAKEAADQARQAGKQFDPQQAKAAFDQQQQQILAKYAPMLEEANNLVPIDDVVDLLRDDRTRAFTFEIESSSTILTDEMEEKQSRNEFLETFTKTSMALMQIASLGEQGAQLTGALLRFALAPYRAGRQLDGAIEAFIDAAPQMAAAAKGGDQDNEGLVEAQKTLAQAETVKAQAAMAKVQADAALAQAQNQQKMADLQGKLQIESDKHDRELQAMQAKADADASKMQLQVSQQADAQQKMAADIDLIRSQTAVNLASIHLDARKQDLDEYQAATGQQNAEVEQAQSGAKLQADSQSKAADHALKADGQSNAQQMAERQQTFTEKTAGAE